MKLSKLICMAILGFNVTSAFAGSNDKFYIAGDAGVFQADFNNRYLDRTDTIKQNIVQPVTQYGYTAGIALGYSRFLNQNYFVGGDISANIDTNNASFQSGASSSAISNHMRINDHFDLTLVPGLMLTNDIAGYLKLGVSYALLENYLKSPAGFNSTITAYNSNKNAIGFIAGLGIEKSITQKLSLFTEANYRDYGMVDYPNFQNFMVTYSHAMHVYSYDVVLGLAYTF